MSYSTQRRKWDKTVVLIGSLSAVANFAVLIFNLSFGTWWLFPIPVFSIVIVIRAMSPSLRRLIENPKEKE